MRWWIKASIEWGLAHVPGGLHINDQLRDKFGELAYLEESSRFQNADYLLKTALDHTGALANLRVVELGTGWVPAVSLVYLLAGARMDTYDISRLVRNEYFVRCRREIDRRLAEYAETANVAESTMRERLASIQNETEFASAATILDGAYRAPVDTRHLPYNDDEVDVVISNLVLQCIPKQLIEGILRETARILKPGGLAIHRVNLCDEYSRSDPRRGGLEFLRFSHKTWNRFFNHSLKHINHLRSCEFMKLFESSGLEIVRCNKQVDWDSQDLLRETGVAREFRHFSSEELLTVAFDVVLRKPSNMDLRRERARRNLLNIPKRLLGAENYDTLRRRLLGEAPKQLDMTDLSIPEGPDSEDGSVIDSLSI